MGKTIYIESTSGISGDMFVAALLDLGADEKKLKEALSGLPLDGYEAVISRKTLSGIGVCDFDVKMDAVYENHDHDMEYLYGHHHGHGEGEEEGHHHGEAAAHHHHGEDAHHHHHAHRGLKEVTEILNAADLTAGARALALRIFDILAEAEAKAHHTTKDEVHFHEVGSVDSIVDITAAAVCFDDLGIDRVILPQLVEGKGTVRCAHGVLPIPVPAVSAILASYRIPFTVAERMGELITPTGAAIAAAVMTDTVMPEIFTLKRTGIGGGKRAYEVPSMLRVMEIEVPEAGQPVKPGEMASDGQTVKPGETAGDGQTVKPGETASDGQTAGAGQTAETKRSRWTDGGGCRKAGDRPETADAVMKLETDIDDCTGEELGYLMDLLYDAGVREAHYHPVYMKKNRPGIELTVLCDEDKAQAVEDIIFTATTTIGIRRCLMERRVLERAAQIVETKYGIIEVKTVVLPDGTKRIYPEYESVKKAAEKYGVSLRDVRDEVTAKTLRRSNI